MTPQATTLWRGPPWALALLLAALGMLGPFTIDTYLPAFTGIATELAASPLQMQQTLSAYLFAFAAMNLLHGPLSDTFGRRPVVLTGVALFTLASVGCALSDSIGMLLTCRALQGLSTGAGIVVARAVVRDLFAPAQAQRVMAQITLFFGIAPAVAPIVGGWLFVWLGWRAVFWALAAFGVLLWTANLRLLPESLPRAHRQPFDARSLADGYLALGRHPRFLLMALASGVPFNAVFVYVLGAPVFAGEVLGLAPTQLFWCLGAVIAGIMAGAWVSGRVAGRIAPTRQVRLGFMVMCVTAAVNLLIHVLLPPHPVWSIAPLTVLAFGWSLLTPSVTLLALDLLPSRRGLAASMLAFVASLANGLVAGVVAPLAMHSALAMATASAALMAGGLLAWATLRHRWPETGASLAANA